MCSNCKKSKQSSLCIFSDYKWCGPGCNGPGKPFNDVDECCQRHDRCLKKPGHSRCFCDSEFINCLGPKVNYHTDKGKKAALMYHAMKLNRLFTCSRF
jgi:hypothetical protein